MQVSVKTARGQNACLNLRSGLILNDFFFGGSEISVLLIPTRFISDYRVAILAEFALWQFGYLPMVSSDHREAHVCVLCEPEVGG